jgi:putative flavoprotein involved in K+ transport
MAVVVSTLDTSMNRNQAETLVIGAGQAGLAVAYHLRRRGLPFVIVDEHERVRSQCISRPMPANSSCR